MPAVIKVSAVQPPAARETVLVVAGLQAVLDSLRDGVLLVGPRGTVTGANSAAEQIFGIPVAQLIGRDCLALMVDHRNRGFLEYLSRTLLPADPSAPNATVELAGRRADGSLVPIEVTSGRVAHGETAFSLTVRDIAERKAHERELRRGANRDRLTGVATRGHVEQLAETELFRVSRYGRPLSLLLFDVDHFKKVNDTHGHPAGDQVLREVARRCQSLVRASDLIGRWGGEEFLVMTPETALDGGSTLGERLRRAVADTPVILDTDERIQVTISVGIAEYVVADADLASLLSRADMALYRAKANGRNRVELATPPEPLQPAA